MSLDGERQRTVAEWTERVLRPECPACGAAAGRDYRDLVALPRLGRRGVRLGGCLPAVVEAVCTNCGHVLLLDAERIGIAPA